MRTYMVFLLVLFPSVLLGQSTYDRFKKFKNQHVNQGMSRTRCDAVMCSRKITVTDSNECKETNTFIDAATKEIKNVCNADGQPYKDSRNLRVSNRPFPIVICKQKGNHRYPRCEYRGHSDTRYIVIGCEDGLPVHFDGDVTDPNESDKNVEI